MKLAPQLAQKEAMVSPEALRKLSGRFPEAYRAFVSKGRSGSFLVGKAVCSKRVLERVVFACVILRSACRVRSFVKQLDLDMHMQLQLTGQLLSMEAQLTCQLVSHWSCKLTGNLQRK